MRSGRAPYPDLPAILAARLRQTPVPIVNTCYDASTISYWAAKMIAAFAAGRKSVTADEAKAWIEGFDVPEQRGAYFIYPLPVLTEAVRVT